MTELLLLLALVGTTLIIVDSAILRPVRKIWPAFFTCAQCVGFWVGVGFGVSGLITTPYGRVMDAFIVGTAGSFLSTLADGVLSALLGPTNDEATSEPTSEQKGPLAP